MIAETLYVPSVICVQYSPPRGSSQLTHTVLLDINFETGCFRTLQPSHTPTLQFLLLTKVIIMHANDL